MKSRIQKWHIWNSSYLSKQLFAITSFLESSMHFRGQPLVICFHHRIFFDHLCTNNNLVLESLWLRNSIELNLKIREFLWTVWTIVNDHNIRNDHVIWTIDNSRDFKISRDLEYAASIGSLFSNFSPIRGGVRILIHFRNNLIQLWKIEWIK